MHHVYKDVATYQDLPKGNVRLEIKAAGSAPIAGYEIYQSGDFDRLDSPDVNDFRWIVNMNALHGETVLSPTAVRQPSVNKDVHRQRTLLYNKLDQNLFF